MKKHKIHLITACFGMAFGIGAVWGSSTGPYLSIQGSRDFAWNRMGYGQTLKTGGGGSLALGYQVKTGFRFETEISFKTHENERYFPANISALPTYKGEDGGKSERLSLMTNVLYDVVIDKRWDYYVGAGAGAARFSGNTASLYPQHNHYSMVDRAAIQLLTGFAYHLTPRSALTAGYRLETAQSAFTRGYRINTGPFSSVELGLRTKL